MVLFPSHEHSVFAVITDNTVIDPRRKSSTAYRLNDNDKNSSGILSKSRKNRQEEMLRIRQKQQEAMDRRAREAATQKKPDDDDDDSQKKKKKAPGVLRKPPAASRGGGYNPMQPWTASQGGGGYKYVRRFSFWPLFYCASLISLLLTLFLAKFFYLKKDLKSAWLVVDEDRSPARR